MRRRSTQHRTPFELQPRRQQKAAYIDVKNRIRRAASVLGGTLVSRRMLNYYRTAQKSIPRAIWLACLGWEATRPKTKTLPTAREYALAHA